MKERPVSPPITPMPVARDAPMVILFGGTFDPPHRAHVELPRRVRQSLEQRAGVIGRAWLVYVPAARSPLKTSGPGASEEDRLAMVRLAIGGAGLERAGVWTDEIDRSRAGGDGAAPSYTIDTVERARRWLDSRAAGPAALRLLIGADQAAQFHRWRRAREVIHLAEPVVMARRGDAGLAAASGGVIGQMGASGFWGDDELEQWRARLMDDVVMDDSSTVVRAALRGAGGGAGAAPEVEPGVLAYIRSRGLYGSGRA